MCIRDRVIALIPALLFGMYNVGYQHFLAVGQEAGFFEKFIYGFLAVLPKIIVSYVVGLGIDGCMMSIPIRAVSALVR